MDLQSTTVKLLDLPFYTEGPCVDEGGNLFFTTLSGGQLLRMRPGEAPLRWAEAGCPNGQVITSGGTHLVCDSAERAIVQFDRAGSRTGELLHEQCAGYAVQCPNDLVEDRYGNVFFTDSVRESGRVFKIGKEGSQQCIADGLDYPNGLALSPDHALLYVAESYQNRIWAISLNEGPVPPAFVWATLPGHRSGRPIDNLPDGLATDAQGRVWVAHYGMQAIQVFSAEATLLASLDTALPLTSNLCFVSDQPHRKSVLITGGYAEPGPGAVLLMTVDM
ncbi:gluconolactonase [Dyadobacter sp. BE34]|uniref:Gluconolactonase n=1 Tax=Dyadobacter fermentans TaxID=94254 RepID=A0ABU1QU38_9BACT|nr:MULTISPECIES: SMP-30/gluconolactonase/LRE family protein [Dyadobacter]MDR6804679.1 gluconolactonase [Dyadobacter fermentans]MDR7043562.1 gluconolactonase [Dyadobacter sp. BE242]MDR7197874.1 gluconolactonase [Dyadobacter sp. BE34]MDR7214693.1 gluconolactonase [Dyadobacter sp. BE31]MDR7262228.1 gluconolactonase [Dyadobacter sp. BE32]